MKKLFLSVSLFFMALAVAMAQEEFKVNNAQDMLGALGSNRTIIIESEAEIDLAKVLKKKRQLKKLGIKRLSEAPSDKEQGVFLVGKTLYLCGFKELTIAGDDGAKLIADTDYMPFICLKNSRSVMFKNLKFEQKGEAKKTKKGELSRVAPMLSFNNCDRVQIDLCKFEMSNAASSLMFANCREVSVENSVFEGTKSPSTVLTLSGEVEKVMFSQCIFTQCSGNAFITANTPTEVIFNQCEFVENEGELFKHGFEPVEIVLEHCVIDHPMELVNMEHVKDIKSNWKRKSSRPFGAKR